MEPFKKKKHFMRGERYVAQLTPVEREVVGNLAAVVSEQLIERCQSAPKDELAELTGMPSGHKDAPDDPALRRLLPDFERDGDEEYDGDNQLLRSLHEQDICQAKLANLQLITSALGPDGSVFITVEKDEVGAWLAALNDLRLYVSECPVQSQEEEDEKEGILNWLGFAQESLVEAVMGPITDADGYPTG